MEDGLFCFVLLLITIIIISIVSSALGEQVPDSVVGRLGIPVLSTMTLHGIFIAYHAYHTIKISHRDFVLRAIESLEFPSTLSVAQSSTRTALLLIRTGHSGH